MAFTFDFDELERALAPGTEAPPSVSTESDMKSDLTSQLFNVLDQGLPDLATALPDSDCASSVCLRVFIHGLMFGLMFLAFILVLLLTILVWLTLRGCFKRRLTNQACVRAHASPIYRPRAQQQLNDVDVDEDLGARPMTPPSRKWGIQRYLARWGNPQLASKGATSSQDGIPMAEMGQSTSAQVIHSFTIIHSTLVYYNTSVLLSAMLCTTFPLVKKI